MEYIQEITLDLNADSVPVLVSAKQADELSRKLKIYLMSDGNEYQPEPDAMVLVRARKPDGTYFVDGAIATINSNIVEVTLPSSALYTAGRALVDIVLYNGSQYLSTASFILKIQPSPSEVMNMAVPTDGNDYPVFLTLMSALGSIEPVVSSAAAEAVAASNSAKYWADSFSLAAGTPMQPGADPSIIGEGPAYTLRLPSIKPMATISIDENGVAASATISVDDFEGTAPTGLDPNLIKVFNFGITLPSGRNVQIDNTLSQPGQAADASAVGVAISSLESNKYTIGSGGLDISEVGIASTTPLGLTYGGLGSSMSNVVDVRNYIHAQQTIQASDEVLESGNAWTSDIQNSAYYQTLNINIPADFNLSAAPHFVASPNNMPSWKTAADVELGPPVAAYVTSAPSWQLTFYCTEVPNTSIGVTIYWW